MNALELFAGAGGASLGLHRAGVCALAMVEWDHHAASTLRAAVATGLLCGDVIEGDVRTVDWTPYAGRVDLLWASPPCQPYSRAGSRMGADDGRDMWPATVDAIRAVRPAWVLIENVTGAPAEEWAGELAALGYVTSARSLDAADYGVPQRRERVFVVAGPTAYAWPRATHYGPKVPWLMRGGRVPWRTMGEALPGLRSVDGRSAYPLGRGRAGTEPWRLDAPAPTVTTTEAKGTRAHGAEMTFNGGPDRASDAAFLATGVRRLTVDEAATLQAFPAAWPFQGKSEARYRQVGNAVPPTMAEALGVALLASARARGAA